MPVQDEAQVRRSSSPPALPATLAVCAWTHSCLAEQRARSAAAQHSDKQRIRTTCCRHRHRFHSAVVWGGGRYADLIVTLRSREPDPPGTDPHHAGGIARSVCLAADAVASSSFIRSDLILRDPLGLRLVRPISPSAEVQRLLLLPAGYQLHRLAAS